MLTKPYHFGVNLPTTLCENKDVVHFHSLKFECHNKYNKLLLCNSENGIVVWCSENNSEWGFCFVFFLKNKNLFLFKTRQKTDIKKQKTQVGWVLLKKRVFLNPHYLSIIFCDFPMIARSGTSQVTIKLIGCALHTQSIGPWYWRRWVLAFEYVKK